MAYAKILAVTLTIIFICNGLPGIVSGNFPLNGCFAGDMDVLCLYLDRKDYYSHKSQESACHWFTQDLQSAPSDKKDQRVLFADVIDRFSAIDKTVNVSSWNFQSSFLQEPYGITEKKAKIRRNTVSEVIEQKIAFIQRLFSEMGGVRINATRIAVTFIDGTGLSYEEIKSIPLIMQHQGAGVKLFIIVMDIDFDTDVVLLNDTLLLSHKIKRFPKRILTLILCHQCLEGWWSFNHNGWDDSLSCYQLLHSNVNLSHNTAKFVCNEISGGHLVAVESKEELDFLRTRIYSYLTEKVQDINRSDGSLQNTVQVYIGLYKYFMTRISQRFKWEWSNLNLYRPLAFSYWKPGKPSGGYTYGCSVWQFDWNGNMTDDTNMSSTKYRFSDGWVDVDCVKEIDYFSLCELVYPHRIESKNSLRIIPATREIYSQALTKGDFIEFKGNIVSVTANIVDKDFIYFYEQTRGELFPLFDCGEDADNQRYISYVFVCDSTDNCSNRRDERFCLFDTDSEDFAIVEEECLQQCLGVTCCDGSCLPLQWVNDGEIDCTVCEYSTGVEFNDEAKVVNTFLKRNETCAFICDDVCVILSQLNDGEVDCSGENGPLDETVGKLERADTCRNILGHIIWAPRCVYVKDMYGSVLGCRDLSHLKNCTHFICPEGYVNCPNSYCIPQHYVFDGTADCPTGEDEQYGIVEDCIGNFACWNSKVCLHPDLMCDRHADCPYKDDEIGCDVSCAEGFRCVSMTITVSDYNRSIPLEDISFIDLRTRYLDFTGLDLSPVRKYFFFHLINARVVKWSNCKIKNLTDMFGYSTRHLQELDISYNLIQTLDGSDFEFSVLQNIRFLNLSYNKELVDVKYLMFTLLETLDLSHTGLSEVDESVLAWLPNLKNLNLSYTYIKHFHTKTFPQKFVLRILDLRGLNINHFYKDFFNSLTVNQHLFTNNFELCCPQIRGPNIPGFMCHARDDAISSCFNLLKVNVQRILLLVVAVLAILGNTTVVIYRVIWDKPVLRTGYGLFVTNLGISDFIMGVYLFIIAGADYYYRDVYVLYEKTWRESTTCSLAGFLALFSFETSKLFILFITVDRFLVMKFPFGQIKFSESRKVISVLFSWTTGFLIALGPIVLKYDMYTSNAMCLGLPLMKERGRGWKYSFSVFIVHNFIISLAIVYGQRAIFRAMSENRITSTLDSRSRYVNDIMVAKQLSLVALSSFLCWFPLGLIGILSTAEYDIGNDVFAWATIIVMPINSAASPLLYTIPALMARWKQFKSSAAKFRQISNNLHNIGPRQTVQSSVQ